MIGMTFLFIAVSLIQLASPSVYRLYDLSLLILPPGTKVRWLSQGLIALEMVYLQKIPQVAARKRLK